MASRNPPAPPALTVLTSPAALGKAVLAARTAAGLSRSAVAREAGVGRQLLIRLEEGATSVQLDNAMAIMYVVGLVGVLLPLDAVRELAG